MVTDCFCHASNSPQTDIPLVNIHVDNKLDDFSLEMTTTNLPTHYKLKPTIDMELMHLYKEYSCTSVGRSESRSKSSKEPLTRAISECKPVYI